MKREEKRLEKLLEKRDALLKQLHTVGPLIDGSLVVINRASRPGTPKYPCYSITYKPPRINPGQASKTKTLYVPVAMIDEVKSWSDECAKARLLIREISEVQRDIIRIHVAVKGVTPS
jgi:hypothetical protein